MSAGWERPPESQIPYPPDYTPTEWVQWVVGAQYAGSGAVWRCFAYDPRIGFWMERVDNQDITNVSEAAIGRTFHRKAGT